MLARFQALKSDPRAAVAEFKYTRMGPLALAMTARRPGAANPCPSRPPARPSARRPSRAAGSVVALADGRAGRSPWPTSTATGRLDIFAANVLEPAPPNALLFARENGWRIDLAHPLAGVATCARPCGATSTTTAYRRRVLVRGGGGSLSGGRRRPGVWRDVTAASRAVTRGIDGIDGALVDADHDGDLDIWLTTAPAPTSC